MAVNVLICKKLRILYTSSISVSIVCRFPQCCVNIHCPDSEEDHRFPFIYSDIMPHFESFQVFVASFVTILVLYIVTPCSIVRKLSCGGCGRSFIELTCMYSYLASAFHSLRSCSWKHSISPKHLYSPPGVQSVITHGHSTPFYRPHGCVRM